MRESYIYIYTPTIIFISLQMKTGQHLFLQVNIRQCYRQMTFGNTFNTGMLTHSVYLLFRSVDCYTCPFLSFIYYAVRFT